MLGVRGTTQAHVALDSVGMEAWVLLKYNHG